ncbi:hypothetical protein AWZ03_009551 [Drosophila navojoa]|uniref:Kazal-like domain-containing protein n=1 Tax=Drosophila navojoa TaxID=7232 RepID=A0A484B6T3_DRONA|nr:uncharacterized protein LOC108650243 [Drosophila navojoa]TDG44002.1 hypothetical protein AWZ03_009551 [Drosophila navojoa]
MRPYQAACIVVAALLVLAPAGSEARRRKHKGDDHHDSHKTKSKVKWSSSSDLSAAKSQVSTEEHSYYVKRTYAPIMGVDGKRRSPPYLAIPIAWFACDPAKSGCQVAGNSGAINSAANALSEGYLCDDDCVEPYEPICGRTPNEVAVFYNKCKLNVAKCRTHGLWTDLPYDQCQQTYPKETAYTDKKFRCSPYFRDNFTAAAAAVEAEASQAMNDGNDSKESKENKDNKDSKDSKESNESSEEQKKQDKKQNKNKAEKVELIKLPLQVAADPVPVPVPQPAAAPVPKPQEAIAMPPMPVKDVVAQAQQAVKPQAAAAAPAVPQVASSMPAAGPVPAAEQVPVEVKKPATPAEPIKEQLKLKSEKDKLKYVVS